MAKISTTMARYLRATRSRTSIVRMERFRRDNPRCAGRLPRTVRLDSAGAAAVDVDAAADREAEAAVPSKGSFTAYCRSRFGIINKGLREKRSPLSFGRTVE